MTSIIIVLAAFSLDALLGEARRWHPLVGFGCLATSLEQRLYRSSRATGVLCLLMAVLPFVSLALLLQTSELAPVFTAVLLYLAIGWKSLSQHALPIARALQAENLEDARAQLRLIVSRDTADIDQQGICRATVESVLENGCDAVFGAVFWALVAGAPGVVLYRLVNTLDAMWGYKNQRYLQFGWAAARLDDLLNFIPARLTSLSYALMGNFSSALRCWSQQASSWKSPNAGPVMAAGAGSLGVLLGGSASYHGTTQLRPGLGGGRAPDAQDIERSLQLVNRALYLWFAVILIIAVL